MPRNAQMEEPVGPRATVDQVVAEAAIDEIVAGAAEHLIAEGRSGDHVVAVLAL